MTITSARATLVAALEGAVAGVEVHPYVDSAVKLPAIFLGGWTINRRETMAWREVTMQIAIVVDGYRPAAAQASLDEMTDAIWSALEQAGMRPSSAELTRIALTEDDPDSGVKAPEMPAVELTVTLYA